MAANRIWLYVVIAISYTVMTLSQLRYFLAVAQAGSLSRAAGQIRVAQPALSQQVSRLEAELGQALFLRHPRGVVLTEAGRRLRERATEILRQVDLVHDELAVDAASPTGSVVVGLATAFNMAFSVAVLTRTRALYPRVRLHLVESMSGFLREWTERGRVDLSVIYEIPPNPTLHLEALGMEELFLIASPEQARKLASSITLRELARLPMVLPGRAHGLRALADRRVAEAGLALSVTFEVDSTFTMKRLVAAGEGYSILSAHAVREEVADGTLAAIPITPPGIPRTVQLATAQARRNDPSVAAVGRVIRDVIAPHL